MTAEELIAKYKSFFNAGKMLTIEDEMELNLIKDALAGLGPEYLKELSDWHLSEARRIILGLLPPHPPFN